MHHIECAKACRALQRRENPTHRQEGEVYNAVEIGTIVASDVECEAQSLWEGVPGLFWNLSRDFVGPHRVLNGWLLIAKVRAHKDQRD